MDINPFLFLLSDLRFRYESDWFRIANSREGRWVEEIERLFRQPRWRTFPRNLRLREAGRDVTDIDFAAYEIETNELLLFQLKWQQPVGFDNRGRRSTGKNLIEEGNRWVTTVLSWLERHGVNDLMQRMRFECSSSPRVRLFVLGRYHVHFTGFAGRDTRATWTDWAHFQQTFSQAASNFSADQLVSGLQEQIERSRVSKTGDSMMYPLGNVAVVLNPTAVPQ